MSVVQADGAGAEVPFGTTDLSLCDREPIHIPGSIQPHGALIGLDRMTGRITTVSSSAEPLLGLSPAQLIGATVEVALGPEGAAALAQRRASGAGGQQEALRIRLPERNGARWSGAELDAVAHRSGGVDIIEMEPAGGLTGAPAPDQVSYRQARAAIARLTAAPTMTAICEVLASEIRALTGFDRVMVYRFDELWNGEVVAEQRRVDLNSFLGLHYPATDIPAQARALYTTNWTRLIADIDYEPSPLLPDRDPSTGGPLDLSGAVLRSVSPIHVEYLSNMGVRASMSVSMVHDGQLWGLVACHHYAGPLLPPNDARTAAEFLGQVASMLISERTESDARAARIELQRTLRELTGVLARDNRDALEVLPEQGDLMLRLVDAPGAAIVTPAGVTAIGDALPADDVARLEAALDRLGPGDAAARARRVDSTDRLGDVLPQIDVAGALRVRIGSDSSIVWVRPGIDRVVDWGGDPHNKALAAAEGDDVRLSPRKSFDKWREIVRGHSAPWLPWQLEAAEGLGDFLEKLLVRRSAEQVSVVESLQRSLITVAAAPVSGLHVAARYSPAQGSQLGGDWWDALALPGGRHALVVGDVAGHGLAAAASMAQFRIGLRAYLLDGRTAASALDALDLLVASLDRTILATALVAIIDPVTGRADIASAGHLPPLLSQGGTTTVLPVRPRPPLGTSISLDRASEPVLLAPGSTLLMYSDGLMEQRTLVVDECIERLRHAAGDGPVGGTQAGLETWLESLMGARLGDGSDDATALAVHLLGVAH